MEATDGSELQVGILADSHDCLPRIKDVIGRLNSEPIELVLHAGDYSAPFVTDYYRALKVHMIGVFGNNDAEKGKLRDRFAEAGHEIKGGFVQVQAGNLRIALTHGTKTSCFDHSPPVGASTRWCMDTLTRPRWLKKNVRS